MAETKSSFTLKLNDKAPNFKLNDTRGKSIQLVDFNTNKAIVIMFICNHCPFVKHLKKELTNLANDYIPKNVSFVAIMSNDVENYPSDSPELMAEDVKTFNYPFPYLYDSTQEVAKSYGAACTPDFFILDSEHKIKYMGQFDDSRPGNSIPVSGKDIRRALNLIIENKSLDFNQNPSLGCNIKWIPGNEPNYYG